MKESIFEHMDFLERGSLPECMKPEEKRITREEFQAANDVRSENGRNSVRQRGGLK